MTEDGESDSSSEPEANDLVLQSEGSKKKKKPKKV